MTYDRRKEAAKGRNREVAGLQEGLERIILRFTQQDSSTPRQLDFFRKMLAREAKYLQAAEEFEQD